MIFLQMASNGNGDNKKNQLSNELKDTMQKWRPFGRSVPAPRNVMLADPELANPIPNRPEAMQSGWVPNPERDEIELESSPLLSKERAKQKRVGYKPTLWTFDP